MNKFYSLILFLLFIAMAILIVVMIFYIKSEGNKCLASPINYGLSKLDEAYETESSAVVNINKGNYVPWLATSKSNKAILTTSDNSNFNVSIVEGFFKGSSPTDK